LSALCALSVLCAAEITSIIGEDAKAAGLGGIYNVGRASTVPPRLVILKYTPTDAVAAAAPSIGLVGKGIVYDTGGLNLKSTGGRGMKGDMAGSAATLGAFVFWAKFSAAHPEAAFPA
jgi:probable aminopeptidase NPEPL1